MDDMPSDGAVAVGPHRSEGMGNELKTSRGAGARVGGMKLREEKRRRKIDVRKNIDKEGVSRGQEAVCTLFLEVFLPLSPVACTDGLSYFYFALYFTVYMQLRCKTSRMHAVYNPTTQKMLKTWKEMTDVLT